MPHNTKRLLVIAILLLVGLVALARADSIMFFFNIGSGAGGSGGGCSNSLDFTQACNSQYAGAVL
jgi:hypothetical protein